MPVVGVTHYNDLKMSISSLVRFAISVAFLNEMYLCVYNAFAMARIYVFLSWPLNNVKLNNFFSEQMFVHLYISDAFFVKHS